MTDSHTNRETFKVYRNKLNINKLFGDKVHHPLSLVTQHNLQCQWSHLHIHDPKVVQNQNNSTNNMDNVVENQNNSAVNVVENQNNSTNNMDNDVLENQKNSAANVVQNQNNSSDNDVLENQNNSAANVVKNHKYLLRIQKKHCIPAYLFLTTLENQLYSVFMVDGQLYSVKLRFHKSLYKGTVLSGEFAKKHRWIFFVNNIHYHMGNCVELYRLTARIKMIAELIKHKFKYDMFISCCDIVLNSYFLINHIPLIQRNCGVYCVPDDANEPIILYYYRQPTDSQNTPHNGTVQPLEITKTDQIDVYEHPHGILTVTSQAMSDKLMKLFRNKTCCNIECRYDAFFNNWVPML